MFSGVGAGVNAESTPSDGNGQDLVLYSCWMHYMTMVYFDIIFDA